MTMRLPGWLHDRICKKAAEEGKGPSTLAREVLLAYFAPETFVSEYSSGLPPLLR